MTLGVLSDTHGPKVAFLFPGQGAQAVGMGQELYNNSEAARNVFKEVDSSLGRSLTEILFNGPEDELKETINAQPAIMAVSLACIKAMEEQLGVDAVPKPVLLAGHSLGEYTALAAAGVLEVGETTWLVRRRFSRRRSGATLRRAASVSSRSIGRLRSEALATS